MPLKEIKQRVSDQIQAAIGTGKAYPRMLTLLTDDDMALVQDNTGRLHAWFVTSGPIAVRDIDVNQAMITRDDTIVIHGFYAVRNDVPPADSSEEEFDAIVTAVLNAINLDRKPAGAGGTKLNATMNVGRPPQVPVIDLRMFGPGSQVLCHHAQMTIVVTRDGQ